jgi:mannose-6-phosphate isomerase
VHCESEVAEGRFAGRTLRDLLKEDGVSILGKRARLTAGGRFPLLLKLLDASEYLSVQVHPDDGCAARLHEPDMGKTEMWHILAAGPGSEIICGMDPAVTREVFAGHIADGTLERVLTRLNVEPGTSVFVPAGTVHAIGGGIVLAEIQQNSDLTYRVYDWGRVQADGTPRELHVAKALEAIHFGSVHRGPTSGLWYNNQGARRSVLAACSYFAAESVDLTGGTYTTENGARTFHILLSKAGGLEVAAGPDVGHMQPGDAILVVGGVDAFSVRGEGTFLDYYVPDLTQDIVQPLLRSGYDSKEVNRFVGDPSTSVIPHS